MKNYPYVGAKWDDSNNIYRIVVTDERNGVLEMEDVDNMGNTQWVESVDNPLDVLARLISIGIDNDSFKVKP